MKTPLLVSALALMLSPSLAMGAPANRKAAPTVQTVAISVTEDGFAPASATIKKGQPVKLIFTRTTDDTCAKAVVFPELKLEKQLPLNQPVEITFVPKKSGDITYGCAMGQMVAAVLHVK